MNPIYYVLIGGAIWSVHTISIKMAGDALPPMVVTWVFYAFALLTLTGILLFSGGAPRAALATLAADPRLLAILVVAGVTIAMTDYFVVTGLGRGAPLSVAIPVFSTLSLALTALAGVIFFKEPATAAKFAGLMLSAAGIFLLMR